MKWIGPDGFEAEDSTDRIDVDVVHGFLSTSYWATGIPREVVERSIAGSLLDHPESRRFMLSTADAHELDRRHGFTELTDPSGTMVVRRDPADLYGRR